MKLPCEMVRDLLPLYHDGVCSEVSGTLVEEHLKECKECNRMRKNMEAEIEMPKLEADEAKPLKSIWRKWRKKAWIKGICIGLAVFLVAVTAWFELTQSCSVKMTAEEYIIGDAYRFSNGMCYVEYSMPFTALSNAMDIARTEDGAVYLARYRPRLVGKQDPDNQTVSGWLFDAQNETIFADASGEEVPLTAIYLGHPGDEDAVLLWSIDMELPLASPEIEAKYLYKRVTNW